MYDAAKYTNFRFLGIASFDRQPLLKNPDTTESRSI